MLATTIGRGGHPRTALHTIRQIDATIALPLLVGSRPFEIHARTSGRRRALDERTDGNLSPHRLKVGAARVHLVQFAKASKRC